MCGIVSAISKRSYGFLARDITAFEQLLYADAVRGEDSTGVIGVNKYGDIYIDKSMDDSRDFLLKWGNSNAHTEICKDGVALIGHNRKSTVGKISDATAHPFVVKGRFAMVHNGTLYNHTALHKTDVDSEALAMHIEEAMNSHEANHITLADALEDVWGAYACVWYNQETDKVQFIRNDQRPLWIAETDDTWFLCSEGSLLHWILGRNGLKYKTLTEISKDTLYTLQPGQSTSLVKEELPEKKATPASPTGGAGTTTGTTNTTTGTGAGKSISDVSKNRYKKLNRKIQGRTLEFWVSDYVERFPFQSVANQVEFIVMGECDALSDVKHSIRGHLNIVEQNILDIDSVDNYYFKGTVASVSYDPRLRQLDVNMKDIVKIPPSLPIIICESNDEKTSVIIH
jgi:hypothetical protein